MSLITGENPSTNYEASPDVSAFSSKFDAFLANPTQFPLSADEMAGYNLFRGKATATLAILTAGPLRQRPRTPRHSPPNSEDTGAAASSRPLFTCFGSANLGVH